MTDKPTYRNYAFVEHDQTDYRIYLYQTGIVTLIILLFPTY